MGIVVKQSITNTIITYIGFAIGAANALFMYPKFLGETYYGLTGYLLSSANVIMPLMAFGVHNTMVKYFNEYKSEAEQQRFITLMLVLPLLFLVPFGIFSTLEYDSIASFLSRKNPIIYEYAWQIPIIGLCMAYFEILYAWVKVHMQSVFGNFVKEIVLRVFISIFLFGVYFGYMSPLAFVNTLMGIYLATTLVMFIYAMRVKTIRLSFSLPANYKPVLVYSFFIILSGSIANILLDIDKNMIGQYIRIENVAYYSVAIFIATVISVPSRAMHQITYPITAKLMSEGKHDELNALYKKTSISLQIVGGLVFLGIMVNINEMYLLLPENYRGGVYVVFTIGLSKYFDLILGNNNSIIFNSKYYRAVLFLGLLLAFLAITLNMLFIPRYGINGAALATLISITLYSIAKLLFVVVRMKLFPFSQDTLKALVLLALFLAAFYYWDFPFHPLVNIGLKSVVVTLLYVWVHYKARFSVEFNAVLDTIMAKVLKWK